MSMKKLLAGALAAVMAVSCLTGCTTAKKSDLNGEMNEIVAATYGSDNIYLDEVNYYLRNTQMTYEYYYTMYGMSDIWSSEDTLKGLYEDTLATILQTKVLNEYAATNNITLTSDEEALVKEAVDSLVSSTEAYMAIAGQDETMLTKICTENAIANKVYYQLKEETEITTTKDDCIQNAVSYIFFTEKEKEATDGETAAAPFTEDQVNAALEAVKGGKSMDDVAAEYGLTVSTANYGMKEEQSTELGKVAIALKKDGADIAYESGSGWYLVYCTSENDETKTESAYESAVDTEKANHFNELYEAMSKQKFTVIDEIVESIDVVGTPVYNIETEAETETAAN